ncbi:MAG: hypothetical protein ACRCU0_02345, partial [Candidatus Rhabdochlamydia sp.]
DKDQQITALNEQIQNSSKAYQEIQNKLSLLQQEKADLEKKTTLTNKDLKETSQLLAKKQQEILDLQTQLDVLPNLQSQLSALTREKEVLQSEQKILRDQLAQANQNLEELASLQIEIKKLTSSSTSLQTTLLAKDQQITALNEQIQNSSKAYQEIQNKLSLLQQEKTDLEKRTTLTNKAHEETSQLLAKKQQEILDLQTQLDVLPNLQSQLSALTREKAALQLEQNNLKSQLAQANRNLVAQSALQAEIKKLTNSTTSLQLSLLDKDQQIAVLSEQTQNSSKTYQEIQNKLALLQQEKDTLEKKTALTNKDHEKISQLLAEKQQEILDLQTHLSSLIQEKTALQLEQNDLKSQLAQANQNLTEQSTLQAEIEQLKITSQFLQANLFTKDQQIAALNEELQSASEVHQELDEKILTMLEAYKASNNPIEADNITREQAPSSPDNIIIPEELLNLKTTYYTLTAPEEDTSIENEERIILKATIDNLQAELENIKPLADHTNNQITTIEKMEASIKGLELELSKKTKITTDLEEEIASLNLQLSKSDTRLKELQRVQYTSVKQQKEIDISSAENTDLLQELEIITKQLFLEKKQIAKLEEKHKNDLADLKDLHEENILKRNEIISTLINDLEQQQPGSCLILMNRLADYVRFNSITQEEKEDILLLIEQAFKNTHEYKGLISSKEEGSSSDEENKGDHYEEDSYFFEPAYQNY